MFTPGSAIYMASLVYLGYEVIQKSNAIFLSDQANNIKSQIRISDTVYINGSEISSEEGERQIYQLEQSINNICKKVY